MFISRIELQNWKNFKEAKADLSQRAFLIGPNASGKSNLLDAFRFLRDIAENGLYQAVDERGGVSDLRCLAARKTPSLSLNVQISKEPEIPLWRYKLTFNQDHLQRPQVRDEKVVDLQSEEVLVSRPNQEDEEDPVRLTQTALEQIVANRDFREVADFFRSISYQHIIPQVVRDPQGFTGAPVQDDPFGRDFLKRLWDKNKQTRDAWLNRIRTVLEDAVPQLSNLEVEMDKQGWPHLVGRYEHWRPHDARQYETKFSDGTLRLFGLLWAMFEGDGPLLLEEPELSLHSEVVQHLPQMLEQLREEIRTMRRRSKKDYEPRQLLISTHSEELLRDKGIGANEVLLIEPDPEGSTIATATEADRKALREGLSVADVLLPKSGPDNGQFVIDFPSQ